MARNAFVFASSFWKRRRYAFAVFVLLTDNAIGLRIRPLSLWGKQTFDFDRDREAVR